MLLWHKLAEESARRCCTSTIRDSKTVSERIKHEGLSFLTITLPAFGKDFEKSLDQGFVDRSLFQGFSWRAGLPRFLGGFLDLVFDRDSGVLLTTPSIDAILSIRQLTLMYGKIALPCSDARERRAMRGYIECEQEVKEFEKAYTPTMKSDFKRISQLLFRDAFVWMDREIYHNRMSPKHGPGKTADKIQGNRKYPQITWPSRLEKIFNSVDFLLPNPSFWEELDEIRFLEPGQEYPVRIVSVPKTLKTPRIIGIEPVAMQYTQQAVLPVVLAGIQRDSHLSSFLGFDDQVPNRRLACQGSRDGSLATLDLSDASDRVSNQLVRDMLENHKHLHDAFDCSRSRKADVPGFGVQRLSKFASMGSALCFPAEAMVFLTLVFIGIEQELNTPLTKQHIKSLRRRVRIYGDDIIVPVDYVRSVVSSLEHFGAKVNVGKSFWNGKFRESCGADYYDGSDVSIVRVREVFPTQRKHATGIISLVAFRNQLYEHGYWATCGWLDDYIRDLIQHFPVVWPTSPVLGRHSVLGYETMRIGDKLHEPQVRGYVVSAKPPRDVLDGYGALLKFFLKRGGLPSVDGRHLERAGRPQSVNIKLRWSPSA